VLDAPPEPGSLEDDAQAAPAGHELGSVPAFQHSQPHSAAGSTAGHASAVEERDPADARHAGGGAAGASGGGLVPHLYFEAGRYVLFAMDLRDAWDLPEAFARCVAGEGGYLAKRRRG
jgi:hypothetical protein